MSCFIGFEYTGSFVIVVVFGPFQVWYKEIHTTEMQYLILCIAFEMHVEWHEGCASAHTLKLGKPFDGQ